MSIHDKVNQALSTFAEVRKLDESSYWDEQIIETLNESYTLDDTGQTTFMMLRGMTDDYLADTAFTAEEILKDPIAFGQRMAEFKNLQALLNDVEVVSLVDAFELKVRENARKYEIAEDVIAKFPALLKDGLIRRDALRSLERLEAHQFLQGNPDTDHLSLNRYVWEFWNINSLITALRDQPTSGITLTLIRDEEHVLASFFVFGIKNGENVTILTDRDDKPHPLYNSMTRRPDRDMDGRAQRHWFPYRLVGLDKIMGENIFGEKIVTGFKPADRTGLVPYDTKGARLLPISELEPEEFLWLMLTAERIDERYGKQNHQLPQLSYTGEMVVRPYALAGPEGSLVNSGTYLPIELPKLVSTDVTEETTKEQWRGDRTGFNSWMEERYSSRVPDKVLNLIGEKKLNLIEEEVGLVTLDLWRKRENVLTTFDPLVFGTEEDIRRDVMWHARHNQMQVIDKLAKEEFEATKDVIREYWKAQVMSRENFLIDAAASLNFPTVSREYTVEEECSLRRGEVGKPTTWGWVPLDTPVNLAAKLHTTPGWGREETIVLGNGKWNHDCVINGKKGSLYSYLYPDNPKALADILGVEETDLPWQLRHWYLHEPYVGNSILDRLDPLEWVADNPWTHLKFRVVVCFSKSGLNARRKQLGLPRYEEVPECERCYDGTPRSDSYKNHCTTCGRVARR